MREGVVGAVMRVGLLGVMIGGLYALLSLAFADAVKDHSADLGSGEGDEAYDFGRLLWDGGSTWSIALVLASGARRSCCSPTSRAGPPLKIFAGVAHTGSRISLLALAAPIMLILLVQRGLDRRAGNAPGVDRGSRLVRDRLRRRAASSSASTSCCSTGRSRRRHSGEIWGALASTDYKNFLRMKIDGRAPDDLPGRDPRIRSSGGSTRTVRSRIPGSCRQAIRRCQL